MSDHAAVVVEISASGPEAAARARVVRDWLLETGEPAVRCARCEAVNRIGDWRGEWTFQVGELAVRFNNWPSLRDEFVAEVGRRLGDRWRLVPTHL